MKPPHIHPLNGLFLIKPPLIMLPIVNLPHNLLILPVVIHPLNYPFNHPLNHSLNHPLNLAFLLHLRLFLIDLQLTHPLINRRNQRPLNQDFLFPHTKPKRFSSMVIAITKPATAYCVPRSKNYYQMQLKNMTLTL